MSLRVWLPLTKDLRNQGLDNITVTTVNTNSFQNEGKLSNKSLDVSGHYAFRVPSLVKKRVFSCAFWYKPITDSSLSDNWRRIIVFDTYTSDGSTTGAIFRFESSYGYQSSSTTYCISIHNNAGEPIASIGTGLGETDGWNKWQHIAITADGTTLKCYRNGIQVASGNMGNGGMLQGTVHIGYSGNRPIGRLNDFRLYDHCLSPMEVKELAKGLVLHYPLNRQGWGQENLMPGTCRADGSNTNKIYGWQANGYGTPEIVTKDGSECIHLQASCSNATTPSIVSASKLLLENGVEYTVSCDLMYDKEIKVTNSTPIHYHNGSTDSTDPFNLTNVNNGKGFSWKSIKPVVGTIIPANTWQHYEMHLVALATPSDSSLPYSTYRAFIYGSVRTVSETATVNMWLKNWKIEKGSIATPWCPNSSDVLATTMGLNSITEYDCSGFCNNGSKGGSTISYTSDTPKYAVSTQLIGTTVDTSSNTKTGAAYITGPCSLSNITALTVTWWAKIRKYGRGGIMDLTSWTSNYEEGTDYNTCPLSNWDSTFRLWDGTNAFNFFSYVLKDSTWHHYAVTFTSGNGKFYRDGVNVANSGTMGNTLTNFNGIRTGLGKAGGVYRQIKEDISDVRIYATALSANDVKSLYQNSAYIDSSGNVYGAIHMEV